uniref:hypothetical protein n=1 Tax=Acetatifactor sp. TaxID=1872090 RepID=UPI004056272F
MNLEIVPTLKTYLIELGFAVSLDRIKEKCHEAIVRERIEIYINQQTKYNFTCTKEEEIDFGALCDYLRTDLLDDVRLRLRGTLPERAAAHLTIVNKTKSFARAKTTIGEKRALDLVNKALEILRSYYRKKVNADLQFIAAEIEDNVIKASEEQHGAQTNAIISEISKQTKTAVSEISSLIQYTPEKVIADGLRMYKDGEQAALQSVITDFTKALSSQHELFPHYGIDFKLQNGTQQLSSVPLTAEAKELYPPNFRCIGTIKIGNRYINRLTPDVIDYANRHQISLVISVSEAEKLLGTFHDPFQNEADALVGQTLTIPPKPFPKAFPCNISLNDIVEFDYILFRTQEVLDDGTIVISNKEQEHFPFLITMRANLATQNLSYSISLDNSSNADMLKFVSFMKKASCGATVTIKALELQTVFAEGHLNSLDYEPSFDTIEEEVEFWEMIVGIEKYFGSNINVPEKIYENEYQSVQYLFSLITGKTISGVWSNLNLTVTLTDVLKSNITSLDGSPFNLTYLGSVEMTLWGNTFKLTVLRKHLSVQPKELERLKKKADALDIGEEIHLTFIPNSGDEGLWEDVLFTESEDSIPLGMHYEPVTE